MTYYIFSKINCLVKINGKEVGVADCNIKTVSITNNDLNLIEFLPLSPDFTPIICYMAQKNAMRMPNLRTYSLNGGYLLIPLFSRSFIPEYKTLLFERNENCSVLVVLDGYYKAIISNENQFKIFNLNFNPKSANVKVSNDLLFLQLKNENENKLIIIQINPTPQIKLIFSNANVKLEREFFTVTRTTNTITRSVIYEKRGYGCGVIDKKQQRSLPIERLSPYLMHCAFLEELLLKANYSDFLHPTLNAHCSLIKDFIGDFYTFIPFNSQNNLRALIVGEDAKILSFSMNENLISDLQYE